MLTSPISECEPLIAGSAARCIEELLDGGTSPWRLVAAFTNYLAADTDDEPDTSFKDGLLSLQILGLVDAVVEGRLDPTNRIVWWAITGMIADEEESDRAASAASLLHGVLEMRLAYIVEGPADRDVEVGAIARYSFARMTGEIVGWHAAHGRRYQANPNARIVSMVRDHAAIAHRAATDLVEFIEADVRGKSSKRRAARREVPPHPLLDAMLLVQGAAAKTQQPRKRASSGRRT